MAALVVPLSSRKARDPSVAGGKGAGLARLLKAGFPVPPGFVIATAALREPLKYGLILTKLEGPAVPTPDPRDVRSALVGAEPASGLNLEAARRFCLDWAIPEKLRRSVLDAYHRLGAGPVAVRSSLVGEDAVAASFAGQLESALDVAGDAALLDAVRRVLASAFSERLWAYLKYLAARDQEAAPDVKPGSHLRSPNLSGAQIPDPAPPVARPPAAVTPAPPSLSLAVVVQSLVRAEVSGVAFSADPLTGQNDVVIEAGAGLGEDLVQGRVRPDRYRLDSRGALVVSAPADPSAPLLGEADVHALAAIVRAIAARSGSPQDVEWARDASGFRVLQARPIASLAGRRLFSRKLVSDMAPGLVRPLIWSTKYRSMVKNVLSPTFKALLKAPDLDYTRLIVRFHSRVYTDMTLVGQSFARLGFPVNYFDMIHRDEKAERIKLPFRLKMLPAFFRLGRLALRIFRMARKVEPFLESQGRKIDAYRRKDWRSERPEALLADLDRLNALHADAQWSIIAVAMNMAVRSRVLRRMIARSVPDANPGDLIKGYGRSGGLAPFEAMRELAATARALEDAPFLERIASGDDLDPAAELAGSDPGRRLLGEFDGFMDRYGFLSANGSDFSETPWVENPRSIWRTVARMALSHGPSASPEVAEAHREEVLARVRAGLGPARRRAFDRLHRSTVRFIGWRERISLLMSEDSYLMRRCALALGRTLAERGVLERPEDVFFLYADELREAVAAPTTPAAKVAARQAELAADAEIDPPETVTTDGWNAPPRQPAPSRETGLDFLTGVGGSAGIVRGRARIVHDPALDGHRLTREDVLVVPFTDIGWTPVLAEAGAIVAETGGQLSHTSIIAREFGVPAVVSVRDATRLIREGQTVTVDGTAGRVTLHPEDKT